MLAKRSIFALNKVIVERLYFPDSLFSQTSRTYSVDHEKRQHEWRDKETALHESRIGDDPEKPKNVFWFPTNAPKQTDFSIGNFLRWFAHQKELIIKRNQRFIPERHEALGADLATAHFLVKRGGRVRFRGNSHWTERDEKDNINLPNTYDSRYIVEAIDVNGFDLRYEGLSNLCGLIKLKWLSLKNCKNIDDWGLDKISAEFPELEYLDISGCEKITERGLECLYRMSFLKTLIVTNYNKSVAFELTCMMLEDCIPGLSCEIK